jgi:hypothetical protein
LQNKKNLKIIEFSGFLGGGNCHLATQKKIKNSTMDILGFFLQNLPYFERNLLKVTIFRHSIHGGQQ